MLTSCFGVLKNTCVPGPGLLWSRGDAQKRKIKKKKKKVSESVKCERGSSLGCEARENRKWQRVTSGETSGGRPGGGPVCVCVCVCAEM